MEHFTSLDPVHLTGSWVTIGSFDGVHLGHQALIRRLVEGAHSAHLPAAAVTFYPHPAAVLRGLKGPFYLMAPEERAAFLGSLGLDVVVTLTFNREMASWSASEFMQRLANALALRRLLVGYDFALGHNREGNLPTLARLGEEMGYTLEEISPITLEGEIVSSSRIRELLGQGLVQDAARLLGRRYAVEGRIVPGDGRGRTIGIPTANFELSPTRLLPKQGVYATLVEHQGRLFPSVSNIGLRPTFENGPVLPRLETHLLDYSGDLYWQTLSLQFAAFLRPEQRFSSIEALVGQINQDIATAREVLNYVP
jgi:riboflavin kinase / FMN adenylyltransferase